MKFDDILKSIGEFGTYQKLVFYVMCLPTMLCGAQSFSFIFMYYIPEYRCQLPDYPNDTYVIQGHLHSSHVNDSIPPGDSDDELYSQCSVYSRGSNASTSTQQCHEWVYDQTTVDVSVISEFNIVCDNTFLRSVMFSTQFAGALIGSFVIGIGADVFGRKKAILFSLIAQLVTSLCAYFAPSFIFLVAVRLFTGVASHALYATTTTTAIELVGPSKRAFTGMVNPAFFAFGTLCLAPLAYFVRDWRDLQLILGLAAVPMLALTVWIIPESARWLVEKERYDEAEKVLEKICRSNKKVLPPGALGADTEDEGPKMKIWKIFGHRVLVLRYLLVIFNWFMVCTLYYGFSLDLGGLGGSLFVNHSIASVFEMFSSLVCLPLLNRFGRKTLFIFFAFVCCLSAIGTTFVLSFHGPDWLMIALNMVGRFTSNCCYVIIYVMSSELFPTVLRYSGIGLCSIFESLGGLLTTYLADLSLVAKGPVGPSIHMIVYASLGVIGALLTFFLPETKDKQLPETIQDAIDFGREQTDEKDDQKRQKFLEVSELSSIDYL